MRPRPCTSTHATCIQTTLTQCLFVDTAVQLVRGKRSASFRILSVLELTIEADHNDSDNSSSAAEGEPEPTSREGDSSVLTSTAVESSLQSPQLTVPS